MVRRSPGSKLLWTVLLYFLAQGQSLDLKDLMDRAVQQSDKLHFLSASLKHDLDSHLPVTMGKIPRLSLCHTSSLNTPTEKSHALSLPEAELLSLIRTLLLSWKDPLLALSSETLSLAHPYKNRLSTKAKQLHEHSNNLSTGLKTLADRMGTLPSSHSPISYDKNLGEDIESQTVNFHFLLSCFRRDSHKIDNFLKILRCKAGILQQACQ
ncbi:prolactin-like [Brienomyrus brachyistius]|uniref:prolactin-like n=1 Tax=Brienomyrus brachyistius TaxID=42636 RepID=UPI0020B208B3|nr:prolactin-like [Brienomyrus brachyistius]